MKKRFGRRCVGLGVMFALASCGGGGGSSGVTPQPTITTPTTNPAPNPTPPPTPPASYPSATDYSANFTFASSVGYASDRFMPNQSGTSTGLGVYLLPEDQSTRLAFTAQPEEVRFSYAGAEFTWTGSERQPGGGQRNYLRDMDRLILGFASSVSTTYVTEATWLSYMGPMELNGVAGRRLRLSAGIVGAPTSSADIPSGGANYRGASFILGGLQSDQFTNQVDSTGSIEIRFGDTVSGGIAVYDRNATSVAASANSILFTGQFDRSTGLLTGTLSSAPAGFTGTFRGRLFGPGGKEIGVAFKLQRASDRAELVGEFIGSR